ncbi:MAG TPA: Gfo/Idh/MocA family oxidoreductase [Isosphaeraceae bacterium]|nr:Gfo/Idh/MocA family oxidoreductase [Isosphaeraceae bacterium]
MSTRKIRVGVIGVGRMGERHCRVYATLKDAELIGVSDRAADRGRAVAARYGVEYFPRISDLIARVDAVSVVTPTDAHYAVAAECLRQGVHVLVEKPLAADVSEARELVHLASRTGCVLQVGHIERFNPAFLELQSVIADIPIIAADLRRLSPFDSSNTDVDVVFDLMIHDIDLTLALLGDQIVDLHAVGRSARTASIDYALATLTTAGGPIVTLTASRVTEQKVRVIEITADGAYIQADLMNKSICIHRRTLPEFVANHQRPLRYRQESFVEWIHIPTAEPLLLELEDFVRCIRDGQAPRVTGADGLRALELAALIRSRLGQPAAPAAAPAGRRSAPAVPAG